MILKASQRGGGANLAAHLMRADDNEHVRVHELRGFAGETVIDAFREAEAVSRATKCRQYLFSLSLSPPESERVRVSVFESAIDRIEDRLGLSGQPRAVVFHEKDGRRHAHCVWSRIDADTMTARALPFFKNRLMEVSRDLYLQHGWTMPRGVAQAGARDPANFTLAEWQRAKRTGIDPRDLKATAQEAWKVSDSCPALQNALRDRGIFLAKGDKRGFVVLDYTGDVHALPRLLDLKTKEVRARLGEGDGLKSVAETQGLIAARMTPALRRHIGESRTQFDARAEKLAQTKAEMTARHRAARDALDTKQSAEWMAETSNRAARLPTGIKSLWSRLTGAYGKLKRQNESEAEASRTRHGEERQGLSDTQLNERAGLQAQVKELRVDQAQRLRELRSDIGRYVRFSCGEPAASRSLSSSLSLNLRR